MLRKDNSKEYQKIVSGIEETMKIFTNAKKGLANYKERLQNARENVKQDIDILTHTENMMGKTEEEVDKKLEMLSMFVND